MTLIKVSDVKPDDKVIVAGMELFVSYIRYLNEQMVSVDFENEITIRNPFLTDVILTICFKKDMWIEKAP